ncbi:hypothetical protein M5K25_022267 [Dendrobium thyrsiflorum]|uniref:Uncharacterized protein n=1 Tax=Dendrobium thyrsiflorum TaxID=117978 RepID=A0ABD0UBU5_DENTH
MACSFSGSGKAKVLKGLRSCGRSEEQPASRASSRLAFKDVEGRRSKQVLRKYCGEATGFDGYEESLQDFLRDFGRIRGSDGYEVFFLVCPYGECFRFVALRIFEYFSFILFEAYIYEGAGASHTTTIVAPVGSLTRDAEK